ncbi:MAG: hypothetical protein MK081_15550 [Flavobacteriales bacterium]|nr:hypothetical protein [Flavobacteriales bacterium]
MTSYTPVATFAYPQGAHFRGALSTVGGMVAAFLYFMTFFIRYEDALLWHNVVGYIIGVPLFVVSFSMFLAVEGIEVDQKARMIRKYSKFLWFKYGEWVPVSNFDKVILKHYKSGHAGHSYHMYAVILKGERRSFILDEYKTHTHARSRMNYFAEEIGLPWHDELVERIQKARSKPRRR